jgi:signal transduction histidine kinase
VQQQGLPPIAIVHDRQLEDDPELLDAAGAIALLAAENAELDAGWESAMRELQRSRARLVRAADDERRRFERNLHDGVQQQLIALKIRLDMVTEATAGDAATHERLSRISEGLEAVLEDVREVGHGLYPPVLASAGLVAALARVRAQAPVSLELDAEGIGRYPSETESAVYYCCLEAIQNATKHAGSHARVTITLERDHEHVRFAITDDGVGMNPRTAGQGDGLTGMRDRIGAIGGELEITSAPGRGTTVRGTAPIGQPDIDVDIDIETTSSGNAHPDHGRERGDLSRPDTTARVP